MNSIEALQVLIEQEGNCFYPIYIRCDTCLIMTPCYNYSDNSSEGKSKKLELAKNCLESLSEEDIFEVLL